MTLSGKSGNPEYINFVELIVNESEKEMIRRDLYQLTQLILRQLANYYDDVQILKILDNVRRNHPLKNENLSCE